MNYLLVFHCIIILVNLVTIFLSIRTMKRLRKINDFLDS